MAMVRKDMLNKENNVKGVRRAKPAPDFSKLHKQWDSKLQKGKAVVKKPLTTVQPFALTEKSVSHSGGSSSSDDFEIDHDAKESILNCEGIKEDGKLHRATIAATRKTPIRSQIPRASFNVSRRGLHKKKLQPDQNQAAATTTASRIVVTRPSRIAYSPSVKKTEELQGFSVDFKPDENALKSILNCEGISLNNNTPSKLSSQFGPHKSKRVMGRVVPFHKPAANSRFSLQARNVTQANPSQASKQRWSIYSRDSFSTKPDLMTWLKGLMDKPVPGRASLAKSTAPVTTQHADNTLLYSQPRIAATERTSFSIPSKSDSELKFSKTLIGYQGDDVAEKVLNVGDPFPVSSYNTPGKKTIAASLHGSTVKSILKKREQIPLKPIPELKVVLPTKTPTKTTTTTPLKTKFNSLLADRTPIRLSAYARNQRLLGLPLPKENRYERMGECITTQHHVTVSTELPVKLMQPCFDNEPSLIVTAKTPELSSAVKRVRWATNIRNSIGPVTRDKNPTDGTQSNSLPSTTTGISPVVPGIQDYIEKPVVPTREYITFSEKLHGVSSHTILPSVNSSVGFCSSSISSTNESWAKVLSSEISSKTGGVIDQKSASRSLNFLNAQPKLENINNDILSKSSFDLKSTGSKTKSKSRSSKRNSVLERIYGDAITFVNDEASPVNSIKSDVTSTALSTGKLHSNSTLPVPVLGEKTMADLMSFDIAEDEYFTGSYMTSLISNENLTNPMQSTMLKTPAMKEPLFDTPIVNDNGTPPSIISMSLNETLTKIPEAPCKLAKAKARTPYKQAMLDYLERAMATWVKKNDDTLDCTVVAESKSKTPDSKHNTKHSDMNSITHKTMENSLFSKNKTSELGVTPSTISILSELDVTEIKLENSNDVSKAVIKKNNVGVKDKLVDLSSTEDILLALNVTSVMNTQPITKPENVFNETEQNDLTLLESSDVTGNISKIQHRDVTSSIVNILSPSMKKFPSHACTTYSQLCDKPTCVIQDDHINASVAQIPFTSLQTTGSFLKPSTFNPSESRCREENPSVLKLDLLTSTILPITTNKMSQMNAVDERYAKDSVIKSASFVPTSPRISPENPSSSLPSIIVTSKPLLKSASFIAPNPVINASNTTFQSVGRKVPTESLHSFSKSFTNMFTGSIATNSEVFSDIKRKSRNQEAILQPALFAPTIYGNYRSSSSQSPVDNFVKSVNKATKSFPHIADGFQQSRLPIKLDTDLFSTLTPRGGVFKTTSNSLSQLNDTTKLPSSQSILKPSLLAERLDSVQSTGNQSGDKSNTDISYLPNDTTLENSVFEEDSDVCVVFSKHQVTSNAETCLNQPLLSSSQPLGIESAFRRVPAICNIIPKNNVNIQQHSDTSTEMRKLFNLVEYFKNIFITRDSVLNAEVSLYSKFGEISDKYMRKIHEKRDGATCSLKKLLTYGDEQHFIPIETE